MPAPKAGQGREGSGEAIRTAGVFVGAADRNSATGGAQTYFGRRLGSPPGLPGGGMIGILPVPVSGVGARISGSTSDGGHSTPSDRASLSPSGSWDWPTVESRGAFAPPEPIRSQLVGDCGGGGAVCCEGVAGVGGDCAIASADVASNAQTINSERFVCMRTQPRSEASVPTSSGSNAAAEGM
jgi:hypothetical protein